jgi:hypothetical protein
MPRIIQPPVDDYIKKSLMTTTGDIIQFNGADPVVLHAGANKQILRMNTTTGLLEYVNDGQTFIDNSNTTLSGAAQTCTVAADKTIATLDIGTIAVGDIIQLEAYVWTTPAGASGNLIIWINQSGGTGELQLTSYTKLAGQVIYASDNNPPRGGSLMCIVSVKTAGTMIISLYGRAKTNNMDIAGNEAYIGARFIKKV